MDQIIFAYYADNAQKLRRIVDKILFKFGGLSNKDVDDFYSLANEVFVDVIKKYDASQTFDGFLYSCLLNRIKTEMTRRNREKRKIDRISVSLDTPIDDDEADTIGDTIPAGIDNGQSIRIREKGEPGSNGGPRGDLLVEVVVGRHPIFQRQDMNIYSTVPMSFAQAALGGDIRISTVDGDIVYTIKPGTQTDTKVRFKGKGVPSLRNKNVRGDHYVTLVIEVPSKLNEAAKKALREFDQETGNTLGRTEEEKKSEKPKKKGFMDKLKETFED